MTRSVKLILYPTKDQEVQFRQYCGTSRFIYNLCLSYMIEQYKEYEIYCSLKDLMSYVQICKYSDDYKWLQDVPEAIQKQAMKDLLSAFKRSSKKTSGFPKYKKKGRCTLSFYQRTDKLHLNKKDSNRLKITGVKDTVKFRCNAKGIKIEDIIRKPLNPRVKYDGKQWYLTFSYEIEDSTMTDLTDEVLGIDLGIKNLAVVSNGVVYKNINTIPRVRKLKKRLKRLQRKVSRKYLLNKVGNKFIKTNNIVKLENVIRMLYRRLSNIRDTYIHEVTSNLVKTKPSKIVIEDLDIKGLMKNRSETKAIAEQCFYKFRQYLTYKCESSGIKLIVADRYYPSTKRCNHCGNVKLWLPLKERTYKCFKCGYTEDRDVNASYNLRDYALAL